MAVKEFKRCLVISIFLFVLQISFGQTVPLGIFYQAVARDNFGKELTNRNIDVKFSVLAENPLGEIVYQELHADVTTTRYGVFSLVIGDGTPTGGIYGELSQINWSGAYHYLKVEVKFDNDFIDMGTMQFLAVPYALYAQKSLEPGPEGPKGDSGPQGDPGDPASDDQTISFDESNLSISGGNSLPLTGLLQTLTIIDKADGNYLGISRGNSVKLSTIEADGDPENELQDITISSDILKITNNASATEWDLTHYLDNTDNQALSWNPVDRLLSVSGNAGTINLSELKNDADADSLNEMQDLILDDNNFLKISKNITATSIDLNQFIDDKQQLMFNSVDSMLSITNGTSSVDLSIFNQSLSFNSSENILTISGGSDPVDLSSLKDDADADPTNEIQDLILTSDKLTITENTSATEIDLAPYLDNTDNQSITYDPATYNLSISGGNTESLGSMIAFRAKKTVADEGLAPPSDYNFITPNIEYNEGSGFNNSTGVFTVPLAGIYTFNIGFNSSLVDDTKALKIFLNGSVYEILNSSFIRGTSLTRSITMKLAFGDQVNVTINPGYSEESGTGSFSGYRVY
jgi:C1q domain